jgi:predicted RNase H-like HicB family nuclease
VTGYVVVIEEGPTSFGAWSPNLPGVVAAGETREECEALMREAIVFHIEGLIEDGDPVPPPSNATAVVFVDPAAA